ncbi:MAG: lipopolysaccharide heptosyltransferase II [Acidobacteriota bacterium]
MSQNFAGMQGQPIDPAAIRRILVRAPNWLGDWVMATPALRAIRERFRDAEIVVLARGVVASACAGQPVVDRVVRYEPRGAHRSLGARWALAQALRRERFDLAVLFPRSFESALWALASGVRCRLGHRGDARAWLLTHRLPAVNTRDPRHHVDLFFDLARALGVKEDPGPIEYVISDDDRIAAREALREAGDDGGGPYVAIHPGVSKAPRGWHPERWEALASRIAKKWGVRLLVLGGPAEETTAAKIAGAAGSLGLSLAGKVSLRTAVALIGSSRLLVVNDSGAMHMAAALGVPVVAIFGPGSPVLTGPWVPAQRFEVITRQFPCSPCKQHFFHECDPAPSGKPYCIETITLDEVWGACERLRARTSQTQSWS